MNFLSSQEARLGLALAVGLLVGMERERRHAERTQRSSAGLRTFGLVGLLGGMFGYMASVPLIVAGALVVGLSAIASYVVIAAAAWLGRALFSHTPDIVRLALL